jgi:hypothetical protein
MPPTHATIPPKANPNNPIHPAIPELPPLSQFSNAPLRVIKPALEPQ